MPKVVEHTFTLGSLFVVEHHQHIVQVGFGSYQGSAVFQSSPLLDQALFQLERYFSGALRIFTLPLKPQGTPFQQRVWQALLTIPYGHTKTYGAIAKAIGNPKASRAVGMANHHNPISIVIPCHRVIGANKTLTGYAEGLSIKAALLKHEGFSDFRE